MPARATPVNWEAVARAQLHPTRIGILERISRSPDPLSPKRLARDLGKPVGNLAHHVRHLHRDGLLKLVSTEPRRGAIEHFYALAEKAKT